MNRAGKILRVIFTVIAFIYIVFVVKYLLSRSGIRLDERQLRLEPFHMFKEYAEGEKSLTLLKINYIGNIALFIPFGILLPGIFKKIRFFGILLAGIISILIIETIQYFTYSGFADIDDVIMNFIGVVIGAGMYLGIFGGRYRNIKSYILSLLLLILMATATIFCIRNYRPDLLPQKIAINGKMISGTDAESYDMRIVCYKMSHGDVFTSKNRAEDRNGNKLDAQGSYPLADTAVFAVAENLGGKTIYRIADIEEMIKSVDNTDHLYVRLWFDKDGKCRMVVLELN